MNLKDYEENIVKQEKGSPCYIDDGGSYFDVKRMHTPLYYKQIEDIKVRLYGFAPQEIDNGLILAHWLSDHGVTGWGGVFDGDDELTYTEDRARKVFLNPSYFLSLNALLVLHGGNYNNYLSDEVEKDIEQAKKS